MKIQAEIVFWLVLTEFLSESYDFPSIVSLLL
jgi:hypothetical protein